MPRGQSHKKKKKPRPQLAKLLHQTEFSPPETETTTLGTPTTVIDAAASESSSEILFWRFVDADGVIDLVDNLSVKPDQACRIRIPRWAFTTSSLDQMKTAPDADPRLINACLPQYETQIQYLANNPPEYGLITNFPYDSWDSACFLWSGIRERLDLAQVPLGDYKKERNYRIEAVGPEGKGVVAVRDFGAGDVIMLDRPAILKPLIIQGFCGPELEKLLEKLLARLPERVRNEYLTLSNCYPEDKVLQGILRTNCIGITLPDNDIIQYQAVAVDLSRCHHSCAPNATYRFTHEKFAFELRALCPIKAGEQVTFSYIPPLAMCRSAASRSKHLQLWHFKCTCSFCTLPPAEQEQSDKRRAELLGLGLSAPDEGPLSKNREAKLHVAIRAMVLSTKERLWHQQFPVLAFLAFHYLAAGDASGWKKWAPKAAAVTLARYGKITLYYFYSTTEPSSLRPFWNSNSLAGMLDEGVLLNKLGGEWLFHTILRVETLEGDKLMS